MFARSAPALLTLIVASCSEEATSANDCGPNSGVVERVIDGDTVELSTGERIRYLLVDTPESTSRPECFGEEASRFNAELVEGRRVRLTYDVECTDRFDRLLAYVEVDGRDVNRLLIEQGFACVLQIPPNGSERAADYVELEAEARREGRGMWGVCGPSPC